MSEQDEGSEPQDVIAYGVKDSALIDIVRMANIGAGLGITLVVEGQVIFGDLISGKNYFEILSQKMLSAGGSPELAKVISNEFAHFGDEHYGVDAGDMPLNYLHIKNYAFLKGDGYPVNYPDTVMRISIEKVSGYAIGRPN